MERTQIYLTEEEQEALSDLSETSGRSKSDLIREAVDEYLARKTVGDRKGLLREARGIWKDRTDLDSVTALRGELDRERKD